MAIEFYRNSPEYDYKEAKYIWYCELFSDIDDQENRIVGHGSNGYGIDENLDVLPDTEIPKDEFTYNYFVDEDLALSVKKIILTIKSDGNEDEVYDSINNADIVRLSYDDACVMGIEEKIIRLEDGTPNVEETPEFHAMKFLFNDFPSDEVTFVAEVIGPEDEVLRTETGIIKIVSAPWDED